jgi:hypothetical protein
MCDEHIRSAKHVVGSILGGIAFYKILQSLNEIWSKKKTNWIQQKIKEIKNEFIMYACNFFLLLNRHEIGCFSNEKKDNAKNDLFLRHILKIQKKENLSSEKSKL